MYLEGEGITEDETEAQNWLWAAADRGYPQANEVLTYIFFDDYNDEYGIGC
jgi:TPR repeat protein